MKLYRFSKGRTLQIFTIYQNFSSKYHVYAKNSETIYIVNKDKINIISDSPHKTYFSDIKTLVKVLEKFYKNDSNTLNNLSVIKEIYL